jgi:hypothetical protein
VHLDHLARPGTFVRPVDVLRHHCGDETAPLELR